MPTYKLQKKHKSPRRVTVRAERVEISIPALIICAVIAFFIWLYVVGISKIPGNLNPEETNPSGGEPTAAATVESASLDI